jgi:multiple sugar transport system permease protein
MALIILFPFYFMIISSLKTLEEYRLSVPTLWPKKFVFRNYIDAFTTANLGRLFFNTLFVGVVCTVISLIITVLTAFAFARLEFKGKHIVFGAMLATMMIPGTILLTPTYIIYNAIGWVNTPLPLMIPGMFGAATCVFFMRQFYSGIPTELIEAAEIDGMNYFGIFFKVMVPLSVPALLAQALLGFIGGYNDYLGPLIYLQDPEMYTLQIAMNQLKSYFAGRNVPAMMAATVISIIPTIILYIIAQKRFVEGVATSGMKV